MSEDKTRQGYGKKCAECKHLPDLCLDVVINGAATPACTDYEPIEETSDE